MHFILFVYILCQHLCTTALCLRGRDLECDAISTSLVGGGIQQLLKGDHGRLSVKLAQLAAHLPPCSVQAKLIRACGQTIKS
jgi:hypothetical protein